MQVVAKSDDARKRISHGVDQQVADLPTPPHNIEIEQSVLGGLIVWNAALEKLEFLKPEHFFEPLHGRIFDVISRLIGEGKSVTAVTLSTFFAGEEVTPQLTVPQYLGRLAIAAAFPQQLPDYGRTVFELATRRALIDIAHDLLDEASIQAGVDPATLIERAEQSLYHVAASGTAPEVTVFKDAVSAVVEQSMAAYQNGGRSRGLCTGLYDLDAALSGGLQPSDLVIVAGRPSMGKTALAINIGWHVADRRRKANAARAHGTELDDKGGVVHVFSLEMTDTQLAGRVLSAEAEIPWSVIRAGSFKSADDAERVVMTSRRIEEAPLYIDYTGGISLPKLATRARRMKRRFGMDLLIIDYLQLMSGGSKAKDGRTQELTQITVGLKALAKELNVPIIALSQLSRAVEQRADKRPQLSDLRESGSIEQDADVVMFVFREEYYVERERPSLDDVTAYADWEEKLRRSAGKAEVILGKQRHGSTGIINLTWLGEYTKFANSARENRNHG